MAAPSPSKVTGLVLLAAGLLAALATTARAQDGDGDTGAEFLRREQAVVAAVQSRDESRLDQFLASDYLLRGAPDIDRATWIHNALTLCWGRRSSIDNFRARRLDGIVITSFVLTFYVDPASCRPALLRSVITDVWRDTGEWRLQLRVATPPPANNVAAQFGLMPEPPATWDVSSELSLVATGGNTSTRTVGIGSTMLHRGVHTTTRASASFLTSETDAVTNARTSLVQARQGVRLTPRFDLFAEASYARNRFAGIEQRSTAAIGAAVKAPLFTHVLTAEGSVGVTAEHRVGGTDLRFLTGTAALTYAWTIRPGVALTNDVALIGDVETAGNWRGTNATTVSITLSRLLSFKASHAIEYRHAPAPGFGRSDQRTAAALVVSMQRRPGGG